MSESRQIGQSDNRKSEIGQSEIGSRTIGNRKSDNRTIGNQTIGNQTIDNRQSKINIKELLPQRKPFITIDRMIHFDEVVTRTMLRVTADNIFVENNEFTEAGIMENIAQTCAARMGYINKYLHSDRVKIGFIGSIKNLVIEELPKVGDTLNTTIEVVSEIFAITLVNARVEVANKLIASCEMKIAMTDDES